MIRREIYQNMLHNIQLESFLNKWDFIPISALGVGFKLVCHKVL